MPHEGKTPVEQTQLEYVKDDAIVKRFRKAEKAVGELAIELEEAGERRTLEYVEGIADNLAKSLRRYLSGKKPRRSRFLEQASERARKRGRKGAEED